MAIANNGVTEIVAYYGDATLCRKHLLHPVDWAEAKRGPDAAKWSLAPQSVISVINGTRNSATGYSVNSPANTNAVYPFPQNGK